MKGSENMKKARATKKAMEARVKLLRGIVRKNPGLNVQEIAQKAGMIGERIRPTLMKLCLTPTKRGFMMYRKNRRFYTAKPTGAVKKPTATDHNKAQVEVITPTVEDVKDAGSFKYSDVKQHMDNKKARRVSDLKKKAQQNDDQQLERWVSSIQLNENRAMRQLDSVTGHIKRQAEAAHTFATELHTLKEAVLDFLDGGVTMNALRQLVGERPKKEGEQ